MSFLNVSVENENSSKPSLQDVIDQIDFIVPTTVVVVLISVSFWLLLSLVHYGIKNKKWKHNNAYNSDKLNAGLVYACVIACTTFSTLRSAFNLTFMLIGFDSNAHELCDAVADIRFVLYALVIFSVQLFLWLRQRIFYTNEMLQVNYSNFVKYFSFVIIIVLFIAGMFAVIYNTLPDNHYSSPNHGCTYIPNENQRPAFWISAATVIVFGQLALVGLFIYALYQSKVVQSSGRRKSSTTILKMKVNKKEKSSNPNDTELSILENSSVVMSKVTSNFHPKSRPRGQTIRMILHKTVTFALLSVTFDVFLLLFAQYAIPPLSHRRFSVMISDVNTFLNSIFLIFSFLQYKQMMTSPCSKGS